MIRIVERHLEEDWVKSDKNDLLTTIKNSRYGASINFLRDDITLVRPTNKSLIKGSTVFSEEDGLIVGFDLSKIKSPIFKRQIDSQKVGFRFKIILYEWEIIVWI